MITFFVPGVPVPKGSAKAYVNKHTGRAQVMQDNREKQRPWASAITLTAMERGVKGTLSPVGVYLAFYMPRLKSHFGTGKNSHVVKPTAPDLHVSKPGLESWSAVSWMPLPGLRGTMIHRFLRFTQKKYTGTNQACLSPWSRSNEPGNLGR